MTAAAKFWREWQTLHSRSRLRSARPVLVAVPNADAEQVVAFVAKNHDGRFITIDADGRREFCAFTNGLWIFSKTLEGGVKAIATSPPFEKGSF